MMKTIKFTLVALATFFSFGLASAQSFGIEGGYTTEAQKASGSVFGVTATSTSTLKGFYVGPTATLDVQGPIALTYGLHYNYLTLTDGNSKTVAHQLDLPVRLQATLPIASGIKGLVYGGPNFKYAISQKTDNGDNLYSQEYNGKKIVSPFDVQLGVGGGIQYYSLALKVGYDWGILNRSSLDNTKFNSNTLKVGLSYTF